MKIGKGKHGSHSGLLPLVFRDATISDTFLTTKFPVLTKIFIVRRTFGNKLQLGGCENSCATSRPVSRW
jgi:hypothetical protein